jgi:hypothetical protein
MFFVNALFSQVNVAESIVNEFLFHITPSFF